MNQPDHSGGTEWFNHQFTTQEIECALVEGGYPNVVIDDPEYIKSLNDEIRQTVADRLKDRVQKCRANRRCTMHLTLYLNQPNL